MAIVPRLHFGGGVQTRRQKVGGVRVKIPTFSAAVDKARGTLKLKFYEVQVQVLGRPPVLAPEKWSATSSVRLSDYTSKSIRIIEITAIPGQAGGAGTGL